MARITASRFALLNVDDGNESDDDQKQGAANQGKGSQPSSAAKKKNKKKKKADQQKENEELRNLAFSKGAKPKSQSGGTGPGFAVLSASSNDHKPTGEKQWEEWKKADKEVTADTYEKDLQQAIMLSKLEVEHKKVIGATGDDGKSHNQKGKKKKKDKPATMSLGEFQQTLDGDKKCEENGVENGFEEPRVKDSTPAAEADPKFFDKVESDAQKILRKEEIQEEYRKQYIVENARTQQFHDELEKKDEEISKLKEQNKKSGSELKEVKQRNQQLCHILAQGEMKGKTAVLMELAQLKQIRDELTEEVSSLTTELEKERSKVHALKSAADKHDKTKGKHGK